MTPLVPLALFSTGVVIRARSRARRAQSNRVQVRQPSEGTLRPQIVVVNDCEAWSIPDAWWLRVAQPRFEKLVAAGARNVASITFALIEGEVGSCPLPPSLDVQTQVETSDDYWAGPPQMLFLAQHVAEAVQIGLENFQQEGGVPTLALPPPVTEET